MADAASVGTSVTFHLSMSQALPPYLVLLLITLGGCATWHTPADKASASRGLPAPRRHPEGAVLEVAFVSVQAAALRRGDSDRDPRRLADQEPEASEDGALATDRTEADDPSHTETGDEGPADPDAADSEREHVPAQAEQEDIWRWIDESVVAPEVRHALRRNGLRIGKAQQVGDFTRRLDRIRRNQRPGANVLEIAEVQSDLSHQARRISCRIGKRYELPVRQPAAGDQAVLVTLAGQTLGQTLSQAQPLFALRATSADVHSIKLSLRPEIQHGAMRQTWVGSDAALRIDNRRDAWSFDELVAEIPLEKGGMLVAGCMTPAFGLGKHMFTGTTADGDVDQVLMVIRVADLPELIDR